LPRLISISAHSRNWLFMLGQILNANALQYAGNGVVDPR
jgi:hypothetical protein